MILSKKKHLVIILMTLVSFFISVDHVSAAQANFTVETHIPDNQVDKSKTYFDLKMSPDQNQTVTATLKNSTEKAVTVEITINSAKTNSNGVIEYGKNTIPTDASLKHPLDSLMTGPSSVTLSPNESKDVTFLIKMPSDAFDGKILGGLTFQQKSSEVTQDASKAGTSVQNEYAYAVAVVLRETDTPVFPNLKLLTVKAGQENYRNVIHATIQNDQAAILSGVKVDAKVYAKDGKTPIYTSVKNELQVAPNTSWVYPISLENTKMEPGTYTLRMTVSGTSAKKSKTWTFSKTFKIAEKEARELNKTAVDVKANTNAKSTNWLLIAVICLIILVAILIILFLLKNKREKQSVDNNSHD